MYFNRQTEIYSGCLTLDTPQVRKARFPAKWAQDLE